MPLLHERHRLGKTLNSSIRDVKENSPFRIVFYWSGSLIPPMHPPHSESLSEPSGLDIVEFNVDAEHWSLRTYA